MRTATLMLPLLLLACTTDDSEPATDVGGDGGDAGADASADSDAIPDLDDDALLEWPDWDCYYCDPWSLHTVRCDDEGGYRSERIVLCTPQSAVYACRLPGDSHWQCVREGHVCTEAMPACE
jgi:hypothetical protein